MWTSCSIKGNINTTKWNADSKTEIKEKRSQNYQHGTPTKSTQGEWISQWWKSLSSRSQLWRNYGTRNIQESSEKYSNNIETCNAIHKWIKIFCCHTSLLFTKGIWVSLGKYWHSQIQQVSEHGDLQCNVSPAFSQKLCTLLVKIQSSIQIWRT